MTRRQTIAHRQRLDRWARQQCWRPDHRGGPVDGMLVALIVMIAVGVPILLRCGGPT